MQSPDPNSAPGQGTIRQTQFVPCSPELIRKEAQAQFKTNNADKADTANKNLSSQSAIYFFVSAVLSCIPGLHLLGFGLLIGTLIREFRIRKLNKNFKERQQTAEELQGALHKMRFMCEGPCPICGKKLILTPQQDPTHFTCPTCNVRSRLENGVATPT